VFAEDGARPLVLSIARHRCCFWAQVVSFDHQGAFCVESCTKVSMVLPVMFSTE
jgi:hypothetical protein